MRQLFPKKRGRTLALVAALLAGTWTLSAVRGAYQVAMMTQKMKTVCVGRMLIDLPAEANVELYGVSIDGFSLEAFIESAAAFSTRVTTREAELRATPDQLGGNKNLESVKDVETDNGLAGKIFIHGRKVTEGQSSDGFTIEHYRYENIALEAHLHGNGISIDLSAKTYDPDLAANLPKLASQLVANPDNHIPPEPGFCFDRAYVRDPLTAEQGERIVMAAGLPSHPDIGIRFVTMAGTKPDSKGLLQRNAESHARAPAIINLLFTNLRAAPRTIGGLSGEELVERVIEQNAAIVYGFEWEVNGTEDNVFLPDVTLKMSTGRGKEGPAMSSLSQPAALALWDQISSSIRFRPTVSPKPAVSATPVAPLGTRASAGDTCPHSGWWQCNDHGDGVRVIGGQRQFIRQGQRMPQALLLPPATMWDRVRRLPPTFESATPTAWKLVDKRGYDRSAPLLPLEQAAPAAPVASRMADTEANTGDRCPASGWWRCADHQALDGTRWFALGSVLPAATFAIRSRGGQQAIRRRTRWQLARRAETDEPERGG